MEATTSYPHPSCQPHAGSRPELAWYPSSHSLCGWHQVLLSLVPTLLPSFLYRDYLPPPSLLPGGQGLWGARDVGRSHFWFWGWRLQLSSPLSPQLSDFPMSRHELGVSG